MLFAGDQTNTNDTTHTRHNIIRVGSNVKAENKHYIRINHNTDCLHSVTKIRNIQGLERQAAQRGGQLCRQIKQAGL